MNKGRYSRCEFVSAGFAIDTGLATGNPNNPRTPELPTNETTMVFSDPSNAVNDPRCAFRKSWSKRAALCPATGDDVCQIMRGECFLL